MKVTDTFKFDDVTVQIGASMIEQDLYVYWLDRFQDVDTTDMPRWDAFLYIASCITSIDGLNWQPPTRTANETDMRESYASFMRQTNMPFWAGLQDTINNLNAPIASSIEKPDAALTEDEKKTRS